MYYNINMTYLLQFDGGSNPNPGKCASAYIIYDQNRNKIAEGGEFIPKGTNNIGEYTGLYIGLLKAKQLHIKNIVVEGDSLLVISQISGKWKVKNETLRVIYDKIIDLISFFDTFECKHIRREYNKHADSLSDKTLDLEKSWELQC